MSTISIDSRREFVGIVYRQHDGSLLEERPWPYPKILIEQPGDDLIADVRSAAGPILARRRVWNFKLFGWMVSIERSA